MPLGICLRPRFCSSQVAAATYLAQHDVHAFRLANGLKLKSELRRSQRAADVLKGPDA